VGGIGPFNVRLDNPLKQGLKLCRDFKGGEPLYVRLDNPLKQGLKLERGAQELYRSKSAWTIH